MSFGNDKHGFPTDPSTDEVFMESHRKDCILILKIHENAMRFMIQPCFI